MQSVSVERPLAADAAAAWVLVSRFDAVANWVPGIRLVRCDGQAPGSLREVETVRGARLVERLLAVDEAARSVCYELVSGPLQLARYRSTLSVRPMPQGCVVSWLAEYVPAPDADPARVQRLLSSTYEAGLQGLQRQLDD